MTKVSRNDLCPCGSGKKYKKCCLEKRGLQKHKVAVLSSSQGDAQPKTNRISSGLFQKSASQPKVDSSENT